MKRLDNRINEPPSKTVLVPIGMYNGIKVDNITIGGFHDLSDDVESLSIIEADAIVWIEVPNPEYNCEVIID